MNPFDSTRTPTPTRYRHRSLIPAAALVLGLALAGCSSTGTEEVADRPIPTSLPADQTGTETGTDEPITGSEAGPRGEPLPGVDVIAADDEGISEAPADEPVVDASSASDTGADVEHDLSIVPQASVGVGESALCATLQIGRDAVVDGDDDLADEQRDLLIERSANLDDAELITIIDDLDPDESLDRSIADAGLERCQSMGFEL